MYMLIKILKLETKELKLGKNYYNVFGAKNTLGSIFKKWRSPFGFPIVFVI